MAGRSLDVVPALSLFDQVPAVYAFWREHLFRDDTGRIVQALWPSGRPPAGAIVLELGCGPGFYARRLAGRFPELEVVGVDRSTAQLERARARSTASGLENCRFDHADATRLPYPDASVDAALMARLLTSVDEPLHVVREMHRVLRPGGRCFVAEPRSWVRAAVPMAIMRLAARMQAARHGRSGHGRSLSRRDRVAVLDRATFATVIRTQPWARVMAWTDGSYQYAVLEKAGDGPFGGLSGQGGPGGRSRQGGAVR